ncbi:MAG TPA: hypothetical protein VLB76_00060 [Thermoanaerobaculia bacterium]|jgi:DUF4097 and DUF4098 domain-containing protein YvlB|nr:hypothetical protein [Thermoanaerobaculia bacterium]
MKKTSLALFCCVLFGVLALPAFADKQDFHWNGPLSPGQTLEVKGFRGHINAEQTDGPAVVDAVKRGDGTPASAVEIKVETSGSGVQIVAVYPKGKDPDDVKVRVDYEVKVPKGVKFIGRTEIGDVVVQRLNAPVEAYTAIGDLDIATSSYAQGRTVNGKINAVMGQTDWSGTLSFLAVNGDVTVKLPTHADVRLSAESKTGHFDTDLFPTNGIGDRYGARPLLGVDIDGTLGRGGRNLKIRTINGNIRLMRND